MKSVRTAAGRLGGLAAFVLVAFALGAIGCKGSGSGKPDASEGGVLDGGKLGDGPTDHGGDGPDSSSCVAGSKAIGDACKCNLECGSGFCADGVCCNSACTEGCKVCNAPTSLGQCVNRSSGDDPRVESACVKMAVATCGLDGKCDGLGGCRKYPVNVMCKPGMCEGDAVVGSSVCDGQGRCKPGPTRICVPFSCNPSTGDCYDSCSTSSQCVSGQQCQNGSCGKRMKGASCQSNDQCVSGYCADGVCCNVACQGACVSCNLTGREGTCWPIEADKPDPRKICKDAGRASCGQTGLCDGFGGCSKYARDTECKPSSCTGNRQITKATCDGRGTCQEPAIQDCHPFACRSGECTKACATNADCDTGIVCMNGTCGKKMDGQPCTASSECEKNHCVDGVCCDQACTGACRSCALSASLGRCTPIAAGTVDPRGVCTAMAQTTCKTNGKCDGTGGCQNWPVGTLCAEETCTGNVYKAPSTCNATGQCVAPDGIPCSPFICNGTRCFTACTTNSQCVNPFSCAANSCGLKELGASCSAGNECRSTFCAQGVCCDSACNGACKSCTAGQLGTCSNVATGSPDPAGLCQTTDPSTCGTNGKCEAGACQKWLPGTLCMPATCPSTSNLFTPVSACDGAGACVTPTTAACFPYRCDTAACRSTCTSDNDCIPPAVCGVNGRCGLKPNGAVCGNKDECLSGFCEQGVCCGTACTGVCKSCALATSRGACANVAAGDPDVLSRCSDQGAPSCGTDGRCDGSGACRLYGPSTVCAGASCPTGQSTQVNARTCNGLGVCQAATTLTCAPYVCNGSTGCLGACTGDADCLPGNICDLQTGRCGNLKRLGQSCTSNSNCLTGNFCVDGVCCSTSSCALCQSCNVGTSAGNCAFTPLGNPDSRCVASPPCGNTGACNGAGACQLAATSVSCGTQSCTGSTFSPVSHCSGSGTCLAPSPQGCSPYTCGTNACKTSCTVDADCVAPFTCQGTAPKSCALKPNGQACSAANQCISGNCVNDVCCGTATCGTCETCAGTSPGTCTPLPAGTAAPAGQCVASPPCGNIGTCNGASGCTQAGTNVSCGLPAACASTTTYQPASFCSGSGTCNQLGTTSCGNYLCSGNACGTSCTADTQCSSTSLYCTGNASAAGSCVAKKANGAACGAANQCASGNCVDGVCCSTSSCGVCQSCSVNGAGTCANVTNGTAEPHNRCAPNGVCGNTGLCAAGACQQQPSSTRCGQAESCAAGIYQPPSNCSGSGTCNQTGTTGCGAYQCGAVQCKTTCTSDNDCAAGNFCAGGSCVAKRGLGAACGGTNQCASGNCVDGVCCNVGSCPTCQACSVNGLGTCAAVGAGMADPQGRCPANGPCGNTGACDGAGSCAQQPSSVACGAAAGCANGTYQPPSFCGGGACNQTSPVSCAPFVCGGGGTCLGSCADTDTQCASGYYCTGSGGTCLAKKGPGASCGAAHECNSGNCVDGVCCTVPSCSTCQACNINGQGTCAAVGAGQPEAEPHGRCAPNGTCGNTGFCVNGACAQVASGTLCAGFSCTSTTTFQPAGSCTGSGSCSIPNAQDCSPYTCATGSCLNSCTADSHCAGGYYCNGSGACALKKGLGDTCGRDEECGSTHCTDGVCCGDASCPTCYSCRVPGSEGTCAALSTGTADARCPTQAASTCGTNGLCEGGACQLYGLGTRCSASCLVTVYNQLYCDGFGGCNQLQSDLCLCDDNGCLSSSASP